ncbi:hypothetical protein EGU81_17585 [Pseudomonas syringae pv. theae]|nr:hypothetical protein [Pseudomonas syringae pv. theae]
MILPEGRGSELARELPGTGSKTSRLGSQGPAEVISFRALRGPSRTSEASPGPHTQPLFFGCARNGG